MGNESENVLVGVVTLAVRQPNDALAEWSALQKLVGDYSARLYKGGSGNDGSTHVEINPTARGITFAAFMDALATNSFYHRSLNLESAAAKANYAQMEFKFEDPDSDGWVELTAVPLQTHEGSGIFVICEITADSTQSGRSGVNEVGTTLWNWTLATLDAQEDAINTICVDTAANWILTRVRLELWEATPKRECYIDSVTIMGTLYAIEPGASTPGLSLSSPYTDIGYTEDGVTFNYNPTVVDIRVEEETVAIDAKLGEEVIEIVCNMAESPLFNIDKAIAGSVLSGNILTIGAGVLKKMSLKMTGLTPAGFIRTYEFPKVVAVGSVGMSYRRTGKTIVPVTFRALKPSGGPAGTFVDNAA